MIVEHNPFSSRFIQPGAIPFLFPDANGGLAAIIRRLDEVGQQGAIIGPHGTGKSTLIAHLQTELTAQTRPFQHFRLQQGTRHALDLPAIEVGLVPESVLIIDGFEQLSWWRRRRVRSFCRAHQVALLVTAHASIGIPIVFQTGITAELARYVLHQLVPVALRNSYEAPLLYSLRKHNGNLREALRDMYDLYERVTTHAHGNGMLTTMRPVPPPPA